MDLRARALRWWPRVRRPLYVVLIVILVLLLTGCGLVEKGRDAGKEVIHEAGTEAKELVAEAAEAEGVAPELRQAVEEEGLGGALAMYWPELLLGQGGLLTVLLATWLGLRARRRREDRRIRDIARNAGDDHDDERPRA